MRICVIGNSHAACLKSGWDELSPINSDFEVTFFASPGAGLSGLKVENSKLIPSNEKLKSYFKLTSGLEVINLEIYDIFVICGLGFRALCMNPSWSEAFAKLVVQSYHMSSLNIAICKKIRESCDRPIIIIPAPLRSQEAAATPPNKSSINNYENSIRAIGESIEISNVTVMGQPSNTLFNEWFTDNRFTENSRGILNTYHSHSDLNHMNKKYGQIIMSSLLITINERHMRKIGS